MKFRHAFLTASLVLLGSISGAYAANPNISATPPTGLINLQIYSDGVNSIEITPKGSINRASQGYVSLARDGEVIRKIPATNVPMLYCIDGYERAEYGAIHVDFWTSAVGRQCVVPGNYTVTFDAGVVLFGESANPNEEFSLNYTIAGAGMNISPADGTRLTEISEITITFPANSTVAYCGGAKGISIENIRSADSKIYPSVTTDGNKATLSFNPAATDPGDYIFEMTAGAFSWTASGNEESSPELYYTYYVEEPSVLPEVTPAPGEYEQFTGLEKDGEATSTIFVLDLPEGQTLKYTSMGSTYLYPLLADGTPDTSVRSYRFSAKENPDNNTQIYLNSVSGQTIVKPLPGEYALVVGSNAYMTNEEGSNKQIQFGPYIIVADDSDRLFSVYPDDTKPVESLSEITLDFPAGTSLEWAQGQYAWLSDGITEYALTPEISGESISFSINPEVSTFADWTLDIAQTVFSVDGQATPVKVIYTVSNIDAVNAVDADADADAIYSISGMRVSTKSAADASLKPGIYIINGKKVVVK